MTQEVRRTEQIARDATTVVTAVVAKRTGIAVDAERHIYSVKEWREDIPETHSPLIHL